MAVVNRLELILSATTDKFNSGMKKASGGVKDFAAKNKTMGAALGNAKTALLGVNPVVALVTTAIVGATVAVSKLTIENAKMAEALQKDALRIGTTAEALSQLQFATEQSGGTAGGFTRALLRQSQAAGEALAGNTQLLDSFKAIGVEVEDLQRLSPEDLFKRVADGLNEVPGSAERSAFGLRILGEGFNELKPLIQEGSEGITALQVEADELGKTVSTKFANDSAAFLDNVGRMQTITSGMGQVIAVEVLPVLNQMLEWAIEAGRRAFPVLQKSIFETVFQTRRLGAFTGILVEKIKDLIPGLEANEEKLAELQATASMTREEFAELREEAEALEKATRDETLAAEQAAASEALRAQALGETAAALEKINELMAEEVDEPIDLEELREVETAIATDLPEAFDHGFTETQLRAATFWEGLSDQAQSFFQKADAFAGGLADTLVQAAEGGEGAFRNFFIGLLKGLAKAIARALILRAILSFFGGGGGLGSFSGILVSGLGGGGQLLPPTRLAAAMAGGGSADAGSAVRSPASRATGGGGLRVVVHEATPSTWVEVTDNQIVPRLDQRRDELNADEV